MPSQVAHYQNAVPGDRHTFQLAAQRAAAPWSLIAGGLLVKVQRFLCLCFVVASARWNIAALVLSSTGEVVQKALGKEAKRLSGPLGL